MRGQGSRTNPLPAFPIQIESDDSIDSRGFVLLRSPEHEHHQRSLRNESEHRRDRDDEIAGFMDADGTLRTCAPIFGWRLGALRAGRCVIGDEGARTA
ncbi:hypothetical protein GCM10023318_31830 [Nocardia callitridis]|uniref:Uncharacterized protein n=1 Tax=Nocardia callitridis TaxID=648753 RepID=A0ABP9KBZ9_9NOCA